MGERQNKDVVIRVRVTRELNQRWQEVTKRHSINGSELLRKYILQVLNDLEKKEK